MGARHLLGQGWLVFIRQGMLAWGMAMKEIASTAPRRSSAASTNAYRGDLEPQIIQVIAAMILHVHQEGHHAG